MISAAALLDQAYALHRSGNLDAASRLYRKILATDPNNPDALFLLGSVQFQHGDFAAALADFDRLLAIKPGSFQAMSARGAVLSALDRHEEALASYDLALATHPASPQVLNNRGNALLALKRIAEAIASYDKALALKPDYADAWRNRGIVLMQISKLPEAVASFDRALAARPEFVDAWKDRGAALMRLRHHAEAVAAYDRALALQPAAPDLLYNRGNAHANLKNYEAAIRDCENLLALAPDYPYARGVLVHAKLQSCDWAGLDRQRLEIAAALKLGKRVITPFNLKALSDSAEEQLRCAMLWVAHECPPSPEPLFRGRPYRHDRIRLAYVSGDFNNTAVGSIMAPVFDRHDKSRFETIAISFGAGERTAMRIKLENGFERFVDVCGKGEYEIAHMIRDMEIDVAVDLMGFTGDCRTAIFGHRPAPIQVNYLGFAGSMGAPYMDYIIADRTVIPPEQRDHYAEHIAYLPDCYLPADPALCRIAPRPTRRDVGLPERGYVFVSFNNSYKFAGPTFDIWMRILHAVPNSVLWLPETNSQARQNLRHEAKARGIIADRIVFAPPLPAIDEHLARLSLADLFLDTLPYNAHSTAIDALAAGVPIVTMLGNSFAGRVAASALKAVNLSETIAATTEDYQRLALSLARDASALAAVKEKLAAGRRTSPLFDIERFTRSLETALHEMWQRHQRGQPPESFAV